MYLQENYLVYRYLFCNYPRYGLFPVGIYLFKVNNRYISAMWEIYSKLTIKTPEQHHRRNDGIDVVLGSLLLTLNRFTHCSVNPIVDFEQVNVR